MVTITQCDNKHKFCVCGKMIDIRSKYCRSCCNRYRIVKCRWKLSQESINNIRNGKLGEKNPMWRGDDASYKSIHYWISTRKPKPSFCEECNLIPPYDLSNISGKCLRDINDYRWLCRSCHMKFDYANGMRTREKLICN